MSLYEGVQTLKRRIGLPAHCDIRFVSSETGLPLRRRKDVSAAGLDAFIEGFDARMRVAGFNAAVARIFGAQVNARAELVFAGRPVNGRLSVASLLLAPMRETLVPRHAPPFEDANPAQASSTRFSAAFMEDANAAS